HTHKRTCTDTHMHKHTHTHTHTLCGTGPRLDTLPKDYGATEKFTTSCGTPVTSDLTEKTHKIPSDSFPPLLHDYADIIKFNQIQFYLYSAITIQLSQGALQSPEPGPPLVQAQWQHGQEKTPCHEGILSRTTAHI